MHMLFIRHHITVIVRGNEFRQILRDLSIYKRHIRRTDEDILFPCMTDQLTDPLDGADAICLVIDHTQTFRLIDSTLRRRNKKIAVVSNKFYAATQQLCRHFFAQQIEVAIGERADIRKKPAPDTVLEALSQLHADKSSAVYVGDSEVDIETARNAGLPCISVLWGFRDRPFLEEHGATCFVERPEQILG